MSEIGAFEAKTKFSALLDRVERGEEIIITRNGKPLARLQPLVDEVSNIQKTKKLIRRLEKWRKNADLSDLHWKDLRDEGRKR